MATKETTRPGRPKKADDTPDIPATGKPLVFSDEDLANNRKADNEDSALVDDLGNDFQDDDFSELFAADSETETVRVQLYRISPTHFSGMAIRGFCQYLDPGQDIGYIKNEYGGGRYRVVKTVGGRYKEGKILEIGGPPKVAIAPPPTGDPISRTESAQPAVYNGIPLSGSNSDFVAMMERIAMIKVFEKKFEPPDVNEMLLKIALERSQGAGSMIDQLGQLKELLGLVEQLGPKSDDNPIVSLASKAVDAFNNYVNAAGKKPVTVVQRPAPVQIAPTATAIDQIPATPAEETKPTPKVEPQPMSIMQIAATAITTIIESYSLSPSMPPQETIDLLRISIPQLDAIKTQIVAHRGVLTNMARIAYNQEFDVEAPDQEKFLLYFNDVFDKLIATE